MTPQIYVYGRKPGRLLHQLPPELVSRKRALCEELMAVLDVITPGLTKERGLTLFELASVILFQVGNLILVDEADIDRSFKSQFNPGNSY